MLRRRAVDESGLLSILVGSGPISDTRDSPSLTYTHLLYLPTIITPHSSAARPAFGIKSLASSSLLALAALALLWRKQESQKLLIPARLTCCCPAVDCWAPVLFLLSIQLLQQRQPSAATKRLDFQ